MINADVASRDRSQEKGGQPHCISKFLYDTFASGCIRLVMSPARQEINAAAVLTISSSVRTQHEPGEKKDLNNASSFDDRSLLLTHQSIKFMLLSCVEWMRGLSVLDLRHK